MSLLAAHSTLMDGLDSLAGKFRTNSAGVAKGDLIEEDPIAGRPGSSRKESN